MDVGIYIDRQLDQSIDELIHIDRQLDGKIADREKVRENGLYVDKER